MQNDSMNDTERDLLLQLIQQSELFTQRAKEVLYSSVHAHVLPDPDCAQLLITLKMEQNFMAIIAERAQN